MKKRMRYGVWLIAALSTAIGAAAQSETGRLAHHMAYKLEMQASLSEGKTPLWLNANRHGLSSIDRQNGYVRAAVVRPLAADSLRRWAVGYGVDAVLPWHYTSHAVVQQAFVEGRWLHGVLSIGSKERTMELKNNELSSGSQVLGINARPVPQARLSLEDYWPLPFAHQWLQLKGHIAYGKMTDDAWQHDFTRRETNYTDGALYHSKAAYMKIQKPQSPFSVELGAEMAAQFGGTSHQVPMNNEAIETVKNEGGLRGALHALIPGGGETIEDIYKNASGNHLGAWMARVNYRRQGWQLAVYGEHFFEDHSAMLQTGRSGYGTGDDWNHRKSGNILLYDLRDMMLGAELQLSNSRWMNALVVEYLYTKYQSGPVYHDHTPTVADQISGNDNYYNHNIFAGWQHWGQVIGNPLYRSPLYNADRMVRVENNRFMAFHLGWSGQPMPALRYRLLATWQEGLGSYEEPFTRKHHFVGLLAEATWHFAQGSLRGWSLRGSYGKDFGAILGSNQGLQVTITKTGILRK